MTTHAATPHEHWSSRFAFIMAAVGSSVGLGNLWRFSSEAGTNGGGAFILVYLLCVVFIGIPVLMCEYAIGRASDQASAVRSVEDVAERSGVSKSWSILAWIGMTAAFMVVCFYCVVAGWVLAYIPKFLFGSFNGLTAEQIAARFGELNSNPGEELIYFTLFAIATVWLVSRGINKGIEWAAKVLMPIFFVLLLGLCGYALVIGDAGQAISWMYSPDFSALSPQVAVSALGQAFFSISIGSAIMITYGSYIPPGVNIPKSAVTVALTDTFVAVIAGMAIFPIVFQFNLAADGGAGLFFQTLPVALTSVPGGNFIGAGFFILAFFAAVTSSISLLEVSTAWLIDKSGFSRRKSAIILGAIVWIIGACAAFSDTFFGLLDSVSGTILLPLSGLLGVIFVGWRMNSKLRDKEIEGVPEPLMTLLMLLIRYVAPIAVAIIFVLGTMQRWLPGLYASIFGGG